MPKWKRLAYLAIAVSPLVPAAATAQSGPGRVPAVPYTRFVLPNGLTAIVYTDRSVPSVSIGVWYRTGSKDEPPGRTGFAHLFEHLMFQQTANRQGDFLTPLQAAGATAMNGTTTQDGTLYYETVPTSALDLALWLESDRMGYLGGGITQTLLDEQRRVVENEKRQAELQPEERARQRFLARFYPAGHPYAHPTIGSIADLDAATLADVRRWFTDRYGASNAAIVLAGDIDAATAQSKLTRYFGAIRAGAPQDRVRAWTPALDARRSEIVHDRFAGDTLSRTWPIANDDPREVTLLQLAARTMAGPRTAALNRALVGEDGVATGVSASVDEGQLTSTMTVSIGLRPGVSPARAGAALDAAVAGFLAAGPSADRLESVVRASDMAIVRSMDSNAAMAMRLGAGEVDHDDPVFFLKQRAWIAAATPAQVRDTAARWLTRPYYEEVQLSTAGETASPATADVDRAHPPVPGPASADVAFPTVTRTVLANGLTLVVAPRHRLPLVDAMLVLPLGSTGAPAIADAALTLLAEGTATRDGTALAAASSRIGGGLSVRPGEEQGSIVWSAPPDRLDASAALVADLVRHPAYPAAAVARAADAAARKRAAVDPDAAAARIFDAALHGRADAPAPAAAEPLTRAALLAFHAAHMVPRGATLYMVGDVTPDAARQIVERHFGDWAGEPPARPAEQPMQAALPPGRIILIDAPGATQSSITVGNLAAADDTVSVAAASLLDTALIGGTRSRLNDELRTRRGWTYGLTGGMSGSGTRRLFTVGGTVEAAHTADSMAAIRDVVRGFVSDHPLTAGELTDAREAAIRSIPLSLADNAGYLSTIVTLGAEGRPYDDPVRAPQRLRAVTLEDARAAATRLYRPDRFVWVVVGDLTSIEPAVRKLGIAPVEVRDAAGRRLR